MTVKTTVEINTYIGNFDNGRPMGKKFYQVGKYWIDPQTQKKMCLYGDFLETMSKREAKNWAKELMKTEQKEVV